MKVKKGDNVLIISGKDKGRTAKILRSLPKERMILGNGDRPLFEKETHDS